MSDFEYSDTDSEPETRPNESDLALDARVHRVWWRLKQYCDDTALPALRHPLAHAMLLRLAGVYCAPLDPPEAPEAPS